MATQNVTFDGSTQINAFGRSFDWDNAEIETVALMNDGSATNDTLNIALSGSVWRIRRLDINSFSETAPLDVNITDASDGIERIVDRLVLGDYSDTTIALSSTRIRFLDGVSEGNLVLKLGTSSLSYASLENALSNTIAMGSGRVDYMDLGDGTNIVNGGSGWISFLEMGQGTNTFNGGTGNFGSIRAWGTNTMTFNAGGDSIVFGSGDTTITLNSGFFGSITGYSAYFSASTVTVLAAAYVGSLYEYDGNIELEVYGQVDQADVGSGDNIIYVEGGYLGTLAAYEGNDELIVLNGEIDMAILGQGNNTVSMDGGQIDSLQMYDGDDNVQIISGWVDSILMGNGNNTAILGSDFINFVAGYSGNDTVTVGTGGAGVIRLEGGDNLITALLGYVDAIITFDGDDTAVTGAQGAGSIDLGHGTNKVTTGAGFVQLISGYGGNDTVTVGSGGAGTVKLDNGDNTVSAGTGFVEFISTFDGVDRITIRSGGAGAVSTGIGNDVVNAVGGRIEALGTEEGNDTVTLGFGGARFIALGDGDDLLSLTRFQYGIEVQGDDGIDTVTLLRFNTDLWVSLDTSEWQNIAAPPGTGPNAFGYLAMIDVENLTGSTGNDTFTGSFDANVLNGFDGNDSLSGLDGNDTLLGGKGDDILDGGLGDDSLNGGAGIDTVAFTGATSVTVNLRRTTAQDTGYGLDAIVQVENVTGSTGNDVLIGNSLGNALDGGDGNDQLRGDLGIDILTGGAGMDTFMFNTTLGVGNVDTITDFDPVFDRIRMDDAFFAGMATGALAAGAFLASTGGVATAAAHRIIYDTDSGDLFFDGNGNVAGGAMRFAVLAPNLAITHADFAVY